MNRMTIERAAEILNDEWLDETDDRLYYYFKNDRLVTHCTEYPDDNQCYFVCNKEQFKAHVAAKKKRVEQDKPIYISKAKRKASGKGLTWELVQTMTAEQLSLFLGEPVRTEAELHELEGDDYIKRAFELFIGKRGSDLTEYPEEVRQEIFENYKQAFLDGVTAHANGNYY